MLCACADLLKRTGGSTLGCNVHLASVRCETREDDRNRVSSKTQDHAGTQRRARPRRMQGLYGSGLGFLHACSRLRSAFRGWIYRLDQGGREETGLWSVYGVCVTVKSRWAQLGRDKGAMSSGGRW